MKVIHLIPAAFDYFDDLEAPIFTLVDKLNSYGAQAEAFTLHYGSASKKQKQQIAEYAPSRHLVGYAKINEVMSELSGFDIVHLHYPFFGLVGPLLKWNAESETPLVLSYHRDFVVSDFFSIFISAYNRYYLPKIVKAAKAICYESDVLFSKSQLRDAVADKSKLFSLEDMTADMAKETNIHLTHGADKLKLVKSEIQALAFIKLYKSLINR